jgi:hypothetical protein
VVYLNGGRCGEGLGKDELKLWQTSQFGDPSQMANLIAKHPSRFSFTTRIPHLEGQEVFGSTKRRVDITVRSKNSSHRHDYVNFSQPRVNATSSGFNVDASESSGIIRDEAFVLTFKD